MKGALRTPIIFLLIAIQSLAASIIAGAALVFKSIKDVPHGVYVGDLRLGGMSYSEAAELIEREYAGQLEKGFVEISVDNIGSYKIPFADIGARIDGIATLEQLKSVHDADSISDFIDLHFKDSDVKLKPVVICNETSLRMKLLQISEDIHIEPVDAEIHYSDGAIVKKADTPGISLNISRAVDVIKKGLSVDPMKPITLSRSDNNVLQTIPASVTIKDFDGIDQIHGEYTTKIANKDLYDSIRFAAEAINGTILPAPGRSGETAEFSFLECLKSKDVEFENDNEGFDQVASTLYAALLKAGIPSDYIARWAHKLPTEYIEPGLDAWISGNGVDLKFSNPYPNKIVILAEVNDDKLTVAIAGNRLDKKENYEISTEVVQKFEPPAFYVENNSLKPGEEIVLNPGKEGIIVNVYRNGELIGTDKYDAEKTIIQVPPGAARNAGGK